MRQMILGLVILFVVGCSNEPYRFQTGVEVVPPHGCIEYRQRGGKC